MTISESGANEYGVVIVEQGRCIFASDVLTRAQADALAAQLDGALVVGVDALRMFKRGMVGR